MANEATVMSSLAIRKVSSLNRVIMQYQSQPSGFFADVSGRKGPVPGAVSISTTGTNVSLAELTTPGLCRIANLDLSNFLRWGIWDADQSRFLPVGKILPGESYVIRLSDTLGQEYGTGTGTVQSGDSLHLRADTDTLNALVEAFEA